MQEEDRERHKFSKINDNAKYRIENRE